MVLRLHALRAEGTSPIRRAQDTITLRCDGLPQHPPLVWTSSVRVLGDDGRELVDRPIHLDFSPH